jgi:anti-sigma regulatory factor (Ser/Thr protein kinase)
MLLSITPADALELIASPRQILKDRVVPAEFPRILDSPYRIGYDWLHSYERHLAAGLEKWLKPHRYELIGENGILCEALSNAFCHGHGKDPCKPIIVRILLGEKGLIVQVKDTGKGFDAQSVYRRYHSRKPYYSSAGNGIRLMARSACFGVLHDSTGTIFILVHLFGDALQGLAANLAPGNVEECCLGR